MNESADPAAIIAALGFPAAVGPIQPVAGGWDTALWRFTTAAGAAHALRLFRADQAPVVERERAGMAAAMAGGVPAPPIEAVGAWQDRTAFVLGWMPGDTLAAALQRRPWTAPRLGAALARVQAQLNAIEAPAALLRDTPGYWLRAVDSRDEALVERLRSLPVATNRLVHLDYHPLNVLTDGHDVTAVLDWTNAAAGDPRADFARTAAMLSLAPLPFPAVQRVGVRLVLHFLHRSWARAYLRLSGPLNDLSPFLAWAGTKLARDTERRLGQPQVWATEADVARMWRWVERWRARAAVP